MLGARCDVDIFKLTACIRSPLIDKSMYNVISMILIINDISEIIYEINVVECNGFNSIHGKV